MALKSEDFPGRRPLLLDCIIYFSSVERLPSFYGSPEYQPSYESRNVFFGIHLKIKIKYWEYSSWRICTEKIGSTSMMELTLSIRR